MSPTLPQLPYEGIQTLQPQDLLPVYTCAHYLVYKLFRSSTNSIYIVSYAARSPLLSRTAYRVESSEEEIIGSTTYHDDDQDNAVYNLNLQSSFILLAAMLVSSFPAGSLGMLDQLPLEVLTMMFGFLDVPSLFLFRGVCRRAHGLVASNFKLNRIITHAATFLVALSKGGMANQFSLDYLYSTLCSEKCESCGRFAAFFQFPTALRCCFSCLRTSERSAVTTRTDCRNIFGFLSLQPLQPLPQFHSLPGIYTPRQNAYTGRYYCMSVRRPSGLNLRNCSLRTTTGFRSPRGKFDEGS